MTDRVLITMDDLESAVPTNAAFESDGAETVLVSSVDDTRAVFRRATPDLVLLTGSLHESRSRDLITMARDSAVPTLGMLEPTEPDPALHAQKLGLTGWLSKPSRPEEIVSVSHRLIERRQLQERTGIHGESPPIQEVLIKIEQLAPVSSTVLIEGESGTGKELVALGIHYLSPRRSMPFIAVNCSALPETLLESELFGHEKGSFTGATKRRLGRFELAESGTLFLDEIGDMQPSVQVKLLRVLETKAFFRVGGANTIHVDVRVVTATNRSLKEMVALGTFREDLYFRLNVLSMYLPPLRERRSDIPILVRRFVRHFSREHNRVFKGITADAMQLLVNAHWPGNVRQLRNLIESMVVLAPGQEIDASDIPSDIAEQGSRLVPIPRAVPKVEDQSQGGKEFEFIFRSLVELKLQIEELRRRLDDGPRPSSVEVIEVGSVTRRPESSVVAEAVDLMEYQEADPEAATVLYQPGMSMAQVERAAIEAALGETRGNRRRAAERLGIGERTLYRKIKEFDIG